jgi:hypothetical protein
LQIKDGVKIDNQVLQELMEGILLGTIKMPSNQSLNVEVEITDFINYQLPLKEKKYLLNSVLLIL